MNDPYALQIAAQLRPGMPSADCARQLATSGFSAQIEGRPWSAQIEDGRLSVISFDAGFPPDIPIDGLHMGVNFTQIDRVHRHVRVVLGLRSKSGRDLLYIDRADHGFETVVELGDRNEICRILLMPPGRLQQRSPDAWRSMNAHAEKMDREREEGRRRGAELMQKREREKAVAVHLASLTDPDERLRYWSENALIWGEPAPNLIPYADWLRTGGPDRWHDAARNLNWDAGVVPLTWIVSQPECDAATALAIFYAGEPFDQPDEGEHAALLAQIRQRWETIGYPVGGIGFTVPGYVRKYPADIGSAKVPLSMRRSISGRTVAKGDYHDGVPIHLFSG